MSDLSILRRHYIKNSTSQSIKIDTPLPCHSRMRKLYSICRELSFNILKKKRWQVCKEHDFERNIDGFKKTICRE